MALVELNDLLEAADVAELIGLRNSTSVGIYRRRYDDFPSPAWTSRGGRYLLWLRPDVEKWMRARGRLGR